MVSSTPFGLGCFLSAGCHPRLRLWGAFSTYFVHKDYERKPTEQGREPMLGGLLFDGAKIAKITDSLQILGEKRQKVCELIVFYITLCPESHLHDVNHFVFDHSRKQVMLDRYLAALYGVTVTALIHHK